MSSVTRDTQVTFVGPDITLDRFTAILCSKSKLTAQDAGDCFKAALDCRVSPAFFLAFFWHESNFGAIGICHDYATFSPGNTRSSRIGVREFVNVPGKGQYIKYDNWRMGAMDACYRLVDPAFTYVKAGAKTIAQILPIWAPGSDNNSPEVYINSVVNLMNKWLGGSSTAMQDPTTQLNLIPGHAGRGRGGVRPKLIVCHVQEGNNDLYQEFLNRPAGNQADCTMWSKQDGTLVRLLNDTDTPWTNGDVVAPDMNNVIIGGMVLAGVGNTNAYSYTIEHQGFAATGFSPAQVEATARICAYWCSINGWTPSRDRIVGHYQVGNHKNCPGPLFPFDKVVARAKEILGGVNVASNSSTGTSNSSTPPNIPPGMVALDNPNGLDIYNDAFKDPVTGFQVIQPFCEFYRDNGGLGVFGHPTSGLYGATPGGQDQTFEFGRLWWDKASGKVMAELKDHNNPKGFDVGVGVMSTLKAEGMVAVSSEQFFTANSGQTLGQRSFTYVQDKTGATYQVQAIEDIDGNGKKIGTWSRQIWQFVKEVK